MLPADVKALVDLVVENPQNDAMFKALLVLLENAPDSAVITEALGAIQPNDAFRKELCDQAADLLKQADASDLEAKWRPVGVEIAASTGSDKVVSLHPQVTHGNLAATQDAVMPKFKNHDTHIRFDNIGGLENVKAQIRRKIIKPFQNPGLFQKFKRRAGGGVLMYGPPGCGKTMMAQALANECDAQFIEARAAEILDKWQGVAEKKIVDIFAQARSSKPAVLFFDEVEALAQRRQSESNVNTMVSTLLNEMAGMDGNNEGLLFLGATNVPWSLDSAFRRPGRFDRTIFVPPPDRIARRFILKDLLRERPVVDDLDHAFIVEKSTGFSGADLVALVETAVDYAIDECGDEDNIIPLSNTHFKEAFSEVRSSTGEWLGLAKSYSEYANKDGFYDDLRDFLKKYG